MARTWSNWTWSRLHRSAAGSARSCPHRCRTGQRDCQRSTRVCSQHLPEEGQSCQSASLLVNAAPAVACYTDLDKKVARSLASIVTCTVVVGTEAKLVLKVRRHHQDKRVHWVGSNQTLCAKCKLIIYILFATRTDKWKGKKKERKKKGATKWRILVH